MERTSGTPEDADRRESWAGKAGRAEGHTASLAAVVFRGMLGGRFPRGLCYRLGRMTSPRYQILNLLAPAAYPRQDIQTVPPYTPRDQPAALTYHIPTTSPHRHYHQNLRLALRLYLSICRAVLTLFVRITPDIRTETHNSPAGRARARARLRSAIPYTEGTRGKIIF